MSGLKRSYAKIYDDEAMSVDDEYESEDETGDYPATQMYIDDDEDYSTQEGEQKLICEACGHEMGYIGTEIDVPAAAAMVWDANREWLKKK